MESIPKIIHLTYKTKNLPDVYSEYILQMQRLHTDWEIRVYDDEACREFIAGNFPLLLATYDSYLYPVQKTDFFRVCIVYLYGGFYLDLDIYCLKSLHSLLSATLVLGIEKVLTTEECACLNHEYPTRIANYMFGSAPQHPFWKDYLEVLMIEAVKPVLSENDILETTGPGLLTRFYHENVHKHNSITLLQNTTRECKKCRRISCHFGEYAAHDHLGSWRWDRK